jgi:hypothetical protein
LLLALHRLHANRATTRLPIDLHPASLVCDPAIGLTRQPAAVALEEWLLRAGLLGCEAGVGTLGAAEAPAEPPLELLLATLLGLPHAHPVITPNATEALEALLFRAARCRPREQDRQRDGEENRSP